MESVWKMSTTVKRAYKGDSWFLDPSSVLLPVQHKVGCFLLHILPRPPRYNESVGPETWTSLTEGRKPSEIELNQISFNLSGN